MAKVNATATVPATPEQAWATAADLSRLDEWLTMHDGWRSTVPKEIEEGTELTSVVKVLGWRNRIEWRVESFTPPRSLAISGNGVGGIRVALSLSVRPSGRDNATVTVAAEVTGRPVFGPIGMAIGRAVRADVRRSVAALAELVG